MNSTFPHQICTEMSPLSPQGHIMLSATSVCECWIVAQILHCCYQKIFKNRINIATTIYLITAARLLGFPVHTATTHDN